MYNTSAWTRRSSFLGAYVDGVIPLGVNNTTQLYLVDCL